MVEEPMKMKKKDQISLDEELAFKLQAEEEEEERLTREKAQREEEANINNQLKNKSFDDIQKLFDKAMKRVNTFIDMDTELVQGSELRAEGKEDKETTELQRIIKVVPDKEEVAIDAILWQLSLQAFHMLKSFNMEDLETLWKLVKAKHGSTRLEEGYERVLWGDLKTMFDPHVEDQGRIVRIKRLHDDLGVTAVKLMLLVYKLLLLVKSLSEGRSGAYFWKVWLTSGILGTKGSYLQRKYTTQAGKDRRALHG
ncbi:hypothetical protein Tco_0638424 [Tanacetum coccineum]